MSRKHKEASPEPERAAAENKLDAASLKATLEDLVARANKGDRSALGRLRRFLDQHPEIHETIGDLTRRAEGAWLDLVVGDDVLARESVQRELAGMKAKLTGAHPTVMEKLLADEITVCYLARQHAEVAVASAAKASLAQAAFRVRRTDSAQRRYLASIKTLATLRALVPEALAPLSSLRVYPGEQSKPRQRA